MTKLSDLIASSTLVILTTWALADDVIGQASVIDGDTLEIHGSPIRIFGIDAPESDQLCRDEQKYHCGCGQKASNALFDFIDRRPVECVEVDARSQSAPLVAWISLPGL